MDLVEAISLLDRPELEWEVTRDTLKLPWGIKPWEYLSFAQEDIGVGDKRGTVNALSNAKRALECEVDSLMIAFGLAAQTRRWSLPDKLDMLRDIAVVAPRILFKINRHRNEMEHQYICPSREEVADFVDVVALFIEATKVHIHDHRCSWEFFLDNYDSLSIELRTESLRVTRKRAAGTLEVPAGSEEYKQLLHAVGRATGWQL